MDESLAIIGIGLLFVICIAIIALFLYCMWMVAGFICISQGWDALDLHAQIITFITMISFAGVAGVRK